MNAIREQLRSMLKVEDTPEGFRATLTVNPDLSIFPDHFRETPLLPGVCMVQAVLLAAAESLGVAELRLSALKSAKMVQPIFPGEQIVIDGDIARGAADEFLIKARLNGPDRKRADFSLVTRSIAPDRETPT